MKGAEGMRVFAGTEVGDWRDSTPGWVSMGGAWRAFGTLRRRSGSGFVERVILVVAKLRTLIALQLSKLMRWKEVGPRRRVRWRVSISAVA